MSYKFRLFFFCQATIYLLHIENYQPTTCCLNHIYLQAVRVAACDRVCVAVRVAICDAVCVAGCVVVCVAVGVAVCVAVCLSCSVCCTVCFAFRV